MRRSWACWKPSASPEAWERAYDEIRELERMLITEGMILVKLWMHISEEEQLRRFESRADDPLKRWKLTDEDWRNREKRPAYTQAAEDMLARTGTLQAPWTLVAGDSKRKARVQVLEAVNAAIESALPGAPPPPAAAL